MSLQSKPYELWMQNRHEGDVALELEVEGENLPNMRGDVWNSKADNSLKIGGVEYIHNGPKKIDTVYETLRSWEAKLIKAKASIYQSDRTSVHVHSNVQNSTMKQILQSIIGYYMLEPALMKHCGKTRKGNLFCLPMEDGVMVNDLIKALAEGSTRGINWDSYRYASLNMGAVKKFGSLEVRTMRGIYDPGFVSQWATNVKSIFDRAANQFKSPVEVFDHYYGRSKKDFIASFLTNDFVDILTKYDGWDDRLNRNHLHLAPIVYETDWDKKEEKPKAPEENFDLSAAPQPPRVSLQRLAMATAPRWTPYVTVSESTDPYTQMQLATWALAITRMLENWDMGYVDNAGNLQLIKDKIREYFHSIRVRQRVRASDGEVQTQNHMYYREWNDWVNEDSMIELMASRIEDHLGLVPNEPEEEEGEF